MGDLVKTWIAFTAILVMVSWVMFTLVSRYALASKARRARVAIIAIAVIPSAVFLLNAVFQSPIPPIHPIPTSAYVVGYISLAMTVASLLLIAGIALWFPIAGRAALVPSIGFGCCAIVQVGTTLLFLLASAELESGVSL